MKKALEDPRAEAAINWMVELSSGDVSDTRLSAFEKWLKQDPGNEAAWIKLHEGLIPFGRAAQAGLPARTLTNKVISIDNDRRKVLKGLAGVIAAGGLSLAITDRFIPLSYLMADQVTRTGEHKDVLLADGSALTMGPRTAIDLGTRNRERGVRLSDGHLLIAVADRSAPFEVETDDVLMRCASGRILAQKKGPLVSFTTLDGEAFVSAGRVYKVSPGEEASFDGRSDPFIEKIDPVIAISWTKGLLIAKNRTVTSVIDDLSPYFPGIMHIHPDVANLRVSAVLKLADPVSAIETVAVSLGLTTRRVANFWISLNPSSA